MSSWLPDVPHATRIATSEPTAVPRRIQSVHRRTSPSRHNTQPRTFKRYGSRARDPRTTGSAASLSPRPTTNSSPLLPAGCLMKPVAGQARIVKRSTEPCAQVRVLPRAHPDSGPDQRRVPGQGHLRSDRHDPGLTGIVPHFWEETGRNWPDPSGSGLSSRDPPKGGPTDRLTCGVKHRSLLRRALPGLGSLQRRWARAPRKPRDPRALASQPRHRARHPRRTRRLRGRAANPGR